MERIALDDGRITTLGTRLTRRCAPTPKTGEPELVDPRVALEEERSAVLAAARDEGLAQGLAQAEQEVLKRLQSAEAAIQDAHAEASAKLRDDQARLQELLGAVPKSVAEREPLIEQLVMEVAYCAVTKMLGAMMSEPPRQRLLEMLSAQALAEYRQRPVVLRVSSDDAPALAPLAGDGITVLGDPALPGGSCRLETHKGLYETGLEVRLEQLKQAFLRTVARGDDAA